MGSTTNRNLDAGMIQQMHGLLQEHAFWIDYTGGGTVCEGTLAEFAEQCDRPYKVPSPIGVDFQYHLDREDGLRVMKWEMDGKEVVVAEFDERKDALAKLEDIWMQELGEGDLGGVYYWNREDVQAALDEWREEQDLDVEIAGP